MGKNLTEKTLFKLILSDNTDRILHIAKKNCGWNKPYASDTGNSVLGVFLKSWLPQHTELSAGGMLKRMLDESRHSFDEQNFQGENIVHRAVNHRQGKSIFELAKSEGVNIDAKDKRGFTPLMNSVIASYLADTARNVEWLLKHGANPGTKNHEGMSSIKLAVTTQSPVALALFFEHYPELTKQTMDEILPIRANTLSRENFYKGLARTKNAHENEMVTEENALYFMLSESQSGLDENWAFRDRSTFGRTFENLKLIFPKTSTETAHRLLEHFSIHGEPWMTEHVVKMFPNPHNGIQAAMEIAMERNDESAFSHWIKRGGDIFQPNGDGRVPAYYLTNNGPKFAGLALRALRSVRNPEQKMNYHDDTFIDAACSIRTDIAMDDEEAKAISDIHAFSLARQKRQDNESTKKNVNFI